MNLVFSRRWHGARVTRIGAVAALTLLLNLTTSGNAAAFFVHPTLGDDGNSGTSEQSPWRTLSRAAAAQFRPGDQLLLAAGEKFSGQLKLEGLEGQAGSPIVISAYGSLAGGRASLPVIDAKGLVAGVNLRNSSHVELRNMAITANGSDASGPAKPATATMRCGLLVEADQQADFMGIVVSNVVIRDVFYENPGFVRPSDEVRTANGTQKYGWGIRFMVHSAQAMLSDIRVTDCLISNVSHTGLKFTAPGNRLRNVRVEGLRIAQTGGPGVQMSGVRGGLFSHLEVDGSGSTNDTRHWKRGSGLWTWGSSDVVIEHSRFLNANGPGDSAGVHIDYNCRNVIVQYNFSANNAGGFCEILGNNYNCAYRYNVSVNDGHRIKSMNGAFQEGKTFWLSGYTGDKSPRQGPFNTYFYNNTIFVGEDITAKISVSPTARGVLIANNIFHCEGPGKTVLGDQNRTDHGLSAPIPDVVFKNNLFLRRDNWPADLPLQDQQPIVGDPGFKTAGGMSIEDYVPSNDKLVKNRGIQIPLIPNDPSGLLGGLKMERDILGRRILGNPDLGAIQMIDLDRPELRRH